MDMEPQYATLSHCWGNDHPRTIRITRTSMSILETGISTKLLSKTCQDAIEIALGAGLNYLWIDSLCIVQGDHNDWEAEASKMASVYGVSALNIAASSAVDGSQGCFLKSENFFGGFEAHLGQGARQTPCQFRTADVYRKAVSESHLATRARALQEKVLAPRTLHCGDQGFFWECRSVIASEFLPSDFVQVHVGDELLVCDPLQRKKLEHSWSWLRNLYSECRLTYPADNLVALSAIAREVQRERKDRYLAGLWKAVLEEQLCWSIYSARPRPSYRAPSWSWASVDGPLWFSPPYERFYARVEDVQVELAGSDPFEAFRSGEITLRYSVMATGVVSSVRIRGRTQQSWGIPYRNMLGSTNNDTSEHMGCTFYVRPDSMDTNDYIPEQPLFLLPTMGGKTANTHTTKSLNGAETRIDDMNIAGIALQLLDPSKRLYTRIGSFGFKTNGSADDYHPFMDVLEKTGAAVTEAACSEIDKVC